jgi:hypothetical protein
MPAPITAITDKSHLGHMAIIYYQYMMSSKVFRDQLKTFECDQNPWGTVGRGVWGKP